MDTVTGVVYAVAFLQEVDSAVDRQPERAALDRDILPRAGIVGQKGPGVYTTGQRRPHELELHIR